MTLIKGFGRKSIAKNIRKTKSEGRPHKKAVAVALSTADRAARKAGKPHRAPKRRKR